MLWPASCRISDFRGALVGAPRALGLPTPAQTYDLRQTFPNIGWYDDDQAQAEDCVGESCEDSGFVATRGQGRRISPKGVWTAARVRERARRTDPIQNVGCDPADAFDALISTGVYPKDNLDFDPSQYNTLETWAEAVQLKKFDPSWLNPIDDGDLDTIDGWLNAGFAVMYWGHIDQAYQRLGPGQVWPGLTGQDVGGHARVFVGYTGRSDSDAMIDWNSWGHSYGTNGFGLVSRRAVRSGQMRALCVSGAPIL